MTNGQGDPNVDPEFQTMLILWIAFLMAIVMYLVMTLFLPQAPAPQNRLLTIVFSAVSVSLVGIAFAVKSKFFARSVETQNLRDVRTGFIIAVALCESAAIMGLLDFFIAHDPYYFLLIGFSFLAVLLHFPRRSQLQAASFKISNTGIR